jgi:hypothetical protein
VAQLCSALLADRAIGCSIAPTISLSRTNSQRFEDEMKMKLAAVLAAGTVAAFPLTVVAQTCTGSASFAAGMVQLGGMASFSDGVSAYGGALAVGAPKGFFIEGAAQQTSYSGASDKSTSIGASAGYSAAIGATAEFCPLVSYTHTSYPDLFVGSSRITSSEDDIGFGGVFGITAPVTDDFNLVPFIGAEYIHASATASSVGVGSSSGSQDYGILELGAGFVISKFVTFKPAVAIPVGLTGGKTAVDIALSFNFGSRAKNP